MMQQAEKRQIEWIVYRKPAVLSLFFLLTILFQEMFLKLYCFHVIPVRGVLYTVLFSAPVAMVLGLWCGSVKPRTGRILLPVLTAVLCAWMATQTVYYYLFKTFLAVGSLSKVGMVAGEFGGLAVTNIVRCWFPILVVCLPFLPAVLLCRFGKIFFSEGRKWKLQWAMCAVILQMLATILVQGSDDGAHSLSHIYRQSDAPELTVTNFGMLTHTRLEVKRLIFGVEPQSDPKEEKDEPFFDRSVWEELLADRPLLGDLLPDGLFSDREERPEVSQPLPELGPDDQVLKIDFEALLGEEENEILQSMHRYFARVKPTQKNEWTGYFEGKNLIWIVAESFSSMGVDPVLTPTLYRLSREGFVFNNFYTPLWGVSTTDGEYVTTTGLIPRAGVWSYLESADNYMPFGFGNQFAGRGYRTLAYHNNTYTYYGRDLSYPNMGYEYYGLGNGLEVTRSWPESDVEMMELSVPQYINEEQFMVYYLTVSGHLNYNAEQNDMAAKHWDKVEHLSLSEGPKGYLATQIELDQAVAGLISQLEAAGKLEETVIVLSGDHYPYGLQDEEISELLGHEVEPHFEKYKSNLILWNAGMDEPVQVDKYCSSLDIMPTLANLFGLEYDSRLIMGRDILSDAPGLVIFYNYSFLSEKGAYVSTLDTFTPWEGEEVTEEYVMEMMDMIRDRVSYSAMILDNDYYRVILKPNE